MTNEQVNLQSELAELGQTIAGMRKQLPASDLDAALEPLLAKQTALRAQIEGGGVITQDSIQSAGDDSIISSASGRDTIAGQGHVVINAETGATVVIGEAPVKMTPNLARAPLGSYLRHIISRNRYLQLQGIRSGGKLVHIELDQIYITLRATGQRIARAEDDWLAAEATLAPGERHRRAEGIPSAETVTVSVNEVLSEHRRLVVLGDPGSGKTTLLRYLALLYARDLAEGIDLVETKLGLAEPHTLPIILPLRQVGAFLRSHHPADDGAEGHALLFDFLFQSLRNERIELSPTLFDRALALGKAVILLDGLDEVADPELRRRVSRLVEAFTRAYPECRYVVTSRVVGYAGPARLGEEYVTTTARDFTLADVKAFLGNWHRLIAIGQMGAGPSADAYAAGQTRQLLEAIEANERVRELAINPLMLTVIAMVHRDRVKLPDRRAELYAEAVDVLLGKWEEAKGGVEAVILEDTPFDAGDRRLMLQDLALKMQEQEQKEIPVAELRQWLWEEFQQILGDPRAARRAVGRFLSVIEERTGLLTARGEGVYAFSHLTFQEYLAALAVAGRDDYLAYTLRHTADPWWREVILLAAGYLSTQSRERTTRLIEAIANQDEEPEPYHNLVLAAQCLGDVGSKRLQGDIEGEIQRRLRADIELDIKTEVERGRTGFGGVWRRLRGEEADQEIIRELINRKAVATEALVKAGAGYWRPPYGEAEWVEIPAGEFWMGNESGESREKSLHKLHLESYLIARAPVTNAQYHLFIKAAGHSAPKHWEDERPPKGLESHPVVNVSWRDAIAYCEWLSEMTGKRVALPSEAEWEKAARGDKDKRAYPWGDTFEATRCNSSELEIGDTTPVGIFPNGASPYGCLDMSGNVWEWTRSIYKDYPYDPDDGRENLEADSLRVARGGAFSNLDHYVRCAYRYSRSPDVRYDDIGFRIVVSPISRSAL